MTSAFTFFAFIFVACQITPTEALTCYECGGEKSSCNDPFLSSNAKTVVCPSGNVCSKGKATIADTQIIVRNCTALNPLSLQEDKCVAVLEVDVCLCTTDLCNFTHKAVAAPIIIYALAVLLSAFM